ncbi:MAG TPA: ATP-binding protein [Micromonospora sp.]
MEWGIVTGVIGALLGALAVTVGRRVTTRGGPARHRATDTDLTPRFDSALVRQSLDALQVGVVVLDAADQPVLANAAARAMGLLRTGAPPLSGSAHPILRTLAGQVRRTGARREVDLALPRGRDDGREPLGVHLRAVGLERGHVAIEATDVTEAHRVARMRRDFVANVSHELKTPIGALQLLAEALRDATSADAASGAASESTSDASASGVDVATVRRFAERIHHESSRLGQLVSELLELTRLQGAEPLPKPDPVSVDWVLAEVLDRTRTAAAARNIDIETTGLRGLTVYGDKGQIVTAVSNLVSNAITYSPERTRVTITVDQEERYVAIAVIDHGIGIHADDLERIFERFYRADQARSRATGGTGLGLAIVKHIATNHGGRIDVVSAPGKGSTFTLRLPAVPPDATVPSLDLDDMDDDPAELSQA